jgi:hypothetical protein
MRQVWIVRLGLVTLAAVVLGVAARAADPPDDQATSPPSKSKVIWFGGMFDAKDKKSEEHADSDPDDKSRSGSFPSWGVVNPKQAQSKGPPESEKELKDRAPASKRDELEAIRAREQNVLLRRLAVCDQIRLVAARQDDDALMQQADRLDEQARSAYTRRMARLPARQGGSTPSQSGSGKSNSKGSASANKKKSKAQTEEGQP